MDFILRTLDFILRTLNEFYPTGKVLTISVYFVAASDCFLITFRFFCAKQVSNSTTRCHEQCINTRLNVAVKAALPRWLWGMFRAPGISSAGVEPVRAAASFGGAPVAQIQPSFQGPKVSNLPYLPVPWWSLITSWMTWAHSPHRWFSSCF